MNKLLQNTDACSAIEKLPLFVGDDFAIVGFGKQNPSINTCNNNEQVVKPVRPDCKIGQSCLCLYKTNSNFEDKIPLSCISLNVDDLLMPAYTSVFAGRGGLELSIFNNMGGSDVGANPGNLLPILPGKQRLFIFGLCDHALNWDHTSFGTKIMYVERSVDNGISVIYVAYADESTEKAYGDCLKKQTLVTTNQLTDQVSPVVAQVNTLMQRGIEQVQ